MQFHGIEVHLISIVLFGLSQYVWGRIWLFYSALEKPSNALLKNGPPARNTRALAAMPPGI